MHINTHAVYMLPAEGPLNESERERDFRWESTLASTAVTWKSQSAELTLFMGHFLKY